MDVDVVAKSLKSHGFNAAPIHGDLEQSQRTKTLDAFRDGSLHILVASDVAARGLDIPAVSHVFNFDVPSHPEDYVHRIGRTGRAGRMGKAFTIAVPSDGKYLVGDRKPGEDGNPARGLAREAWTWPSRRHRPAARRAQQPRPQRAQRPRAVSRKPRRSHAIRSRDRAADPEPPAPVDAPAAPVERDPRQAARRPPWRARASRAAAKIAVK